MANSPITALVLREERNSQAVGTSWIHFSFVSSLSYHTWRQWNYWSLFRMVMEKPITSVLKGMSHQGELCGVPFQPQGELCSALGYPGALQSPTSPWATRGPLDLLFSSPIHPPLFCILALNPETNFIFFSWHFKAKPSFFWKWHAFSHLVLGKHKPFSPSQCYSCDYLYTQSLFFS